MENDQQYFLKISGNIDSSKRREFVQTIQFLFNHIPLNCIAKNLAQDVHISNLYHIYLLLDSKDALSRFKSSYELELLIGAFKTLGEFKDVLLGRKSDLQLFDIRHLDN